MTKLEKYFKNGILTENRNIIIKALINSLIANKMNPKLSNDQIIEVYEQTREVSDFNEQLAKKTTAKDLIMSQIIKKGPGNAAS
jgi:hypothetical protein